VLKGRRKQIRSVIGVLATGIAVAALAGPAYALESARGLQVSIETRFLNVEEAFLGEVGFDVRGLDNQVVITGVTIGSNKDIVIGDTVGIVDPIPAVCARVDPTIIRCPPDSIDRFVAALGLGRDELIVTPELDTVTNTIKMKITARFAGGSDSATDDSRAKDSWFGGPGRDKLDTGPAGDKLKGGPGVDRLWAGPGSDVLFGGGLNDLLFGQAGLDVMHGGPGIHDRCRGGAGRDFANGCEDVIRVR
jgi:Ca2+-binding RTX toxin-like protein